MTDLFSAPVEIDDDDVFGEDITGDLPKPGQIGYGHTDTRKTSGTHSKPREHYPRLIERLQKRKVPNEILPFAGGAYWKCDYQEITFSGMAVSKDLQGFMDLQGIVKGRFIGLQVTSLGQGRTHLHKYTNPKTTHGQGKRPVEGLLRDFLSHGGVFLLAEYYKSGKFWEYKWTIVTEAVLDEVKGSKRVKK